MFRFCVLDRTGLVLARLGGTAGPGPFSQARFTELVMAALTDPAARGSYNATQSRLELAARAAEEQRLERAFKRSPKQQQAGRATAEL